MEQNEIKWVQFSSVDFVSF